MTALFADTSFWIALSSRRDEYRARALAWSRDLTRTQASILTTEAVLWGWMNALSDSATRRIAAAGYYRCHRDAHIEVIPFSADLVDAAMQLYGTQHDKNWSLTELLLLCCYGATPPGPGTDHRSPLLPGRL